MNKQYLSSTIGGPDGVGGLGDEFSPPYIASKKGALASYYDVTSGTPVYNYGYEPAQGDVKVKGNRYVEGLTGGSTLQNNRHQDFPSSFGKDISGSVPKFGRDPHNEYMPGIGQINNPSQLLVAGGMMTGEGKRRARARRPLGAVIATKLHKKRAKRMHAGAISSQWSQGNVYGPLPAGGARGRKPRGVMHCIKEYKKRCKKFGPGGARGAGCECIAEHPMLEGYGAMIGGRRAPLLRKRRAKPMHRAGILIGGKRGRSEWIEYVRQYAYDHFPISWKEALVKAAPGWKLLKKGQAWL